MDRIPTSSPSRSDDTLAREPEVTTMDPTQLPKGILLDDLNFIPWKARINDSLRAHSLPSSDCEQSSTMSEEAWMACSGLAAKVIHNFVPDELLKQVITAHRHDHAKLMRDLEIMLLRFRFLDLPPELRNTIYAHLMLDTTLILINPLWQTNTCPSIISVSRQVRAESLPFACSCCEFVLNFGAPESMTEESAITAEQTVDIPARSRKWAKSLSGPHKKYLRDIRVRLRVQCQHDATESELRTFGFEYIDKEGLKDWSYFDNGCLIGRSDRMIAMYAQTIEEERKMLHMRGESIIMAVTRDNDIFRYGTLQC